MAIVDLATYRSLTGADPTYTLDDAQATALLTPAENAVMAYTGRKFEVATTATVRQFLYDGSGFLDIDDCTAITSVEAVYPNTPNRALTTDEWTAMPDGGPVSYYLIIHGGTYAFGISPEMGFTWNLDQYPQQRSKSPTIAVTATWGWPAIPDDVKLAIVWTVQSWIERPSGDLTSEAIEGWSRSWGRGPNSAAAQAIPERARDLLANFERSEY